MAQNRTRPTDLRLTDAHELQQTVSDLRNILRSLSTVVTRLEKTLDKYSYISDDEDGFESAEEELKSPVSVLKRVQSFQKQKEKNVKKTLKLESVRSVRTPESARTPEAFNDTTINAVNAKNAWDAVKNIKKKFEHLSEEDHDSSNEENNKTESKEIKVNVQSLKQKFEVESNEEKSKIRRKSEDNKTDELKITGEYADKVKKILKYFQPQSR